MIADFEQRLAFILGARLAAPLAGQVFVPPAPAPGADASLVVGVSVVRQLEPSFLTRKPEVVPGAPDPRRIQRLECEVTIQARAGQNQGRDAQVRALDAVLYELGASELESGAALTDAQDRGFFIEEMLFSGSTLPLDPSAPAAPPTGITLLARGFFWPVGQAGVAGLPIDHIRLRGADMDVDIEIPAARLVAGGPATDATLHVRAAGSVDLDANGAAAMPFGSLALQLFPGRGTLGGGADGATAAIRIVPLVNEVAQFTYAPPAQAAEEELIVAFDNHEGGLGPEIGRVPLRVRGA